MLSHLATSAGSYFSLHAMPEGVDYVRVLLTDEMAAQKMRMVEKAAENGWPLGVYHQRRLTTNLVDADFVVVEVPPPKPSR